MSMLHSFLSRHHFAPGWSGCSPRAETVSLIIPLDCLCRQTDIDGLSDPRNPPVTAPADFILSQDFERRCNGCGPAHHQREPLPRSLVSRRPRPQLPVSRASSKNKAFEPWR